MKRCWHGVVALLCASLVPAQGREGRGNDAELSRTQRQLQQSRSEAERLLDLRLRHDLGLPTAETERLFRQEQPVGTEAMERMQQELRDTDAENQSQRERYNKLKAAVDQLRADAQARAQQEQQEQQGGVLVPTAGSTVATPRASQQPQSKAGAANGSVPAPAAGTDVPFPLPEATPVAVTDPATVAARLDPMRATITGSTDHQRVAMALFRSGLALIERGAVAREQGQPELAKELEERGREKLQRALDELAPLLQQKEPPFVALFYQGRCRELLFRHDERHGGLSMTAGGDYRKREQEVRDPFLQITARDVRKTGSRGDVEVLGPWGMAAQAAVEHFRWMNLNASYDATAAIAALRWPGDGEQ